MIDIGPHIVNKLSTQKLPAEQPISKCPAIPFASILHVRVPSLEVCLSSGLACCSDHQGRQAMLASINDMRVFSRSPFTSRTHNRRLQRLSPPAQCGPVINSNTWNGDDPLPQQLSSTSVKLHRPAGTIDGLTLFQLAQSRPYLRELRVSAAAFTSPMQGQWNLRNLQKLHVDFSELPDHTDSVEQFLQHAEPLYLKELKLTYSGPGFASLQANSIERLHVENLQLNGFEIYRSAKLAKQKGRLVDCVLDVSKLELFLFYKSAPELELDRCRLSQTLSWRTYVSAAAAIAFVTFTMAEWTMHPTATTAAFAVILASVCWAKLRK